MVRKIIIALIGFLSLLGVLWYLGYFDAVDTGLESQVPIQMSEMRVPSAQSWAIFDVDSGVITRGHRHRDILPIASITKLFTAYAAVASNSLEETAWVTRRDLATEGSSGKLQEGERLSVRGLLFPLLVESSNDAGVVIDKVLNIRRSEKIYELSDMLSLKDTHIAGPTGLDPANVSSAEDLAAFFSYIHTRHGYITDITQLRMYFDGVRGLVNNDPLHKHSAFRGGKQGFLPEAGKTFVGVFELADGGEIGVVLLNSEDLLRDTDIVLEYAEKAR